ncbi:MAG: hypothetical protein Q8O55_04325 [Dehalococcoidales bacterium]|nr:hypothetical protein [Dehalococcoidales bacterium]
MSEELRWKILDILVRKRRYTKNYTFGAEEIAKEINIGLDYVHEELDKMEYLGLVELFKSLGPTYAAEVTPAGLLAYDEAGKD